MLPLSEHIPSPPSNVTVDEIGPTSATVKWDPPMHHEQNVEHYDLFYKIDSYSHGFVNVRIFCLESVVQNL